MKYSHPYTISSAYNSKVMNSKIFSKGGEKQDKDKIKVKVEVKIYFQG